MTDYLLARLVPDFADPATWVQLVIGVLALTSVRLARYRRVAAWRLLLTAHGIFLTFAWVSDDTGWWLMNIGMIIFAAQNWHDTARDPHWA